MSFDFLIDTFLFFRLLGQTALHIYSGDGIVIAVLSLLVALEAILATEKYKSLLTMYMQHQLRLLSNTFSRFQIFFFLFSILFYLIQLNKITYFFLFFYFLVKKRADLH